MKMMNFEELEAKSREIKEYAAPTAEDYKREALESLAEALEQIGSRLTKKRRENAAQAIHCARWTMIRHADTTAKDVRAALKVLTIVDEGAENAADELRAFDGWNDVPEAVRDLLKRLGYPVEHVQTAEEKATAEAKAVAAGTLMAVRNACKKYDKDAARIVVKASAEAFAEVLEEHAEKLQQLPEIAATYRAAADELADMLQELDGVEQTAEEPAEPKTIAQHFAEKRAEREKFEAFKSVYLAGHPSTAKRFAQCVRIVDSLEQQAEEVYRALEALQRMDEMAAHGPAGIGPNGLPLYYADRFEKLEAPEYLEHLKAEAAPASEYIAKTLEKIRKAFAEYVSTTEGAAAGPVSESERTFSARVAFGAICDECEAMEATGTREAMHEAKKLRTLAAEALAHFLRTRAGEWLDELAALLHESYKYSPDGLQNQRSGAEGTGYHPRE